MDYSTKKSLTVISELALFSIIFFFLFRWIISLYSSSRFLFYVLNIIIVLLYSSGLIAANSEDGNEISSFYWLPICFELLKVILQFVFLFNHSWGLVPQITNFSINKVALIYSLISFFSSSVIVFASQILDNMNTTHKQNKFQKMQEKAETPSGQFCLAEYYKKQNDIPKSIEFFEKSIRNGYKIDDDKFFNIAIEVQLSSDINIICYFEKLLEKLDIIGVSDKALQFVKDEIREHKKELLKKTQKNNTSSDEGNNTNLESSSYLQNKPENSNPDNKEIQPNKDTVSSLMQQLDSMIGLSCIKEEVHTMIDQVKVNKLKEEAGINVTPGSMHLVFTGNPGTGKTTVARLIGKIYYQLGITKNDVFVEADRSKFVAEYMGQTAIKTENLVKSALGGILFVDEAYALNQGVSDDYGREAIDTLLKLMEDNRKNLVVIIAGYTNEINSFLCSNPGLKSRFSTTLHFEDYNAEELKQIFLSMCKKNCYELLPEAVIKLEAITKHIYDTRSDNFANAREMRNLYERVLKNQASRLAQRNDIPSKKDLLTITEEDFKTF